MLSAATSIEFNMDCMVGIEELIILIIFLMVQSIVQMKSDLSNKMKASYIRGKWMESM